MATKLKDLRFYKFDLPDESLLFRWAETSERLFRERWDPSSEAWVSAPTFTEVTGIGGSADFDLISEDEVIRRLTPTLGENSAKKAARAGL